MKIRSEALVLGLLFLAAAMPAQALRCGTRLISEGDHVIRLLRYCGEPRSVDSRSVRRGVIGNIDGALFPGFFEDVLIEEWTYNFGPRKLMRLVRIENGIVAEISHLGYGFHER
jgi:hypothetical protein